MASLAKLYREAKKAGIPASEVRGKSAEEIQEMLSSGGSKTTPSKKKAVAKAKVEKKRGRGRPKGSKNKTTTESKPAKKRGRPKGSTNKTTTTKAKPKATSGGNGGRNLLSKVNYSNDEGWNPRKDSPPDRIIRALKKFKGDREKVFEFLKKDIWDFMGKKMRDGSKRSREDAESMLRYRIARTDWQFAMQTGQHEKSENRAEYGTAGTGAGTFKPAKAAKKSSGRPAKKSGSAQKASKASKSNGSVNPKEMNDKTLRKYLKSFEGKRGRRPAEHAVAVKEAKKRKLSV
jgi:hypothetical protein